VHQAPAPERPIAGGFATPALLAQVLVSKYCDHAPLYRQSQIFSRHGVELDLGGNWQDIVQDYSVGTRTIAAAAPLIGDPHRRQIGRFAFAEAELGASGTACW
jgi:hypothetical protein